MLKQSFIESYNLPLRCTGGRIAKPVQPSNSKLSVADAGAPGLGAKKSRRSENADAGFFAPIECEGALFAPGAALPSNTQVEVASDRHESRLQRIAMQPWHT